MTDNFPKSPIRIPVKLVDEQWEFFYGGRLRIKSGAIGELIIEKNDIKDKKFLSQLTRTREHKILEAGIELLVALTIKTHFEVNDPLKKCLIPISEYRNILASEILSSQTQFVKVTIGEPTLRQKRVSPNDTGGVWLHLQGSQPKGISTSSVKVPDEISKEPLESLNYAFTRLSEKFEPWRKSHTGNIYERFLYKEKNGRWYPLDILRNAAIAKDEHQLIREQWALLSEQLKLN